MAKQSKVSPARRSREEDDSILLRSAETIGRVIGTLQRQLDGARGRFSDFVRDKEIGSNGTGSRPKHTVTRKKSAAKTPKVASTAKKAPRAAKSVGVKKTTKSTSGRKRSRRAPSPRLRTS
jgi:hypothetical protein